MKDKKRTFECVESSKERKLSEPLCKAKKLSKEIREPSVPKNLPKPVILSPIKVIKPKPSSNTSDPTAVTPAAPNPSNSENSDSAMATIKPSDATNSSSAAVLDPKVKKKGHDPPDGDVLPSKDVETKNNNKSVPSSSHSEPEQPGDKIGEPSKNECCENSKKQTNLPGKNDLVPKTEKSDGSYQANSAAKENGRVHLCEVDNIFKLNTRNSDCNESRNGKSKDLQKTDKIVAVKEKNFRKSTLSSRNSTVHKKSIALRKPRIQANMPMCRTRAQSNIQKLKV